MQKKILTYVGIIVAFLVISYGFVPEVLGGKIVNQSDITGYIGMANEANTWNSEHPDDRTAWTDSMFGGMPTIMLTGNNGGDATQPIYDAFFVGKRPASYLFISLLGAFLLMLAMGIHPFLAAGGAIAITFCSYNLQIIQVGHNAKMVAIAWAPWVLAAVIYSYKRALNCATNALKSLKDWAGALIGPILAGIALSFQIKANHVQITYYIGIIIVSYVVVLFFWLLAKKKDSLKKFFITSALLLVFAGIGIATNANRLVPTWEYTQETMRGGSELTRDGGESSSGLAFDYATQWSYGTDELPNLMIANYNGGSSTTGMYWGPQPFTAGPMYIGAITVFLFILGLCLPKGKEKWWLLIPTIFAILLALGGTYGRTDFFSSLFKNFNVFWFQNTPFYNKFRTVSMALVILQFTMPLLGFYTLNCLLKGDYDKKTVIRRGGIALGITGFICLILWMMPEIAGNFKASHDPAQYSNYLVAERIKLLRGDALTSLLLILASAILILWSLMPKPQKAQKTITTRRIIAGAGICLMVAVNLFVVGKRYLNSSHFVSERQFKSHFTQRPVDKYILEDKTISYRVADLTTSIFNDATPSYWHKSVGGYSPVKLQRYQDLIDNYLMPELYSIGGMIQGAQTIEEAQAKLGYLKFLSLLNCKYIILGDDFLPLENPNTLGNAWFVDSCIVAGSPDEEIALIGEADLEKVAVLPSGTAVEALSAALETPADSTETISLTSYAPNQLTYDFKTSKERLVVFSEIWCNYGWKAWTEDKAGNKTGDIKLVKADWTLRAAVLPQGEGRLVMRFQPESYAKGRTLSAVSSWLLILLGLACVVVKRPKRQQEP